MEDKFDPTRETPTEYVRRQYKIPGKGKLSADEKLQILTNLDQAHPIEDRPTTSHSLHDASTDAGRKKLAHIPDGVRSTAPDGLVFSPNDINHTK